MSEIIRDTNEPMTLTDFLLARIAEDEATAKKAMSSTGDGQMHESWVCDEFWHVAIGEDRMLAECEAKRRIVEACREDYEYAQGRGDDTTELAEEVMWHLALPYADHPDYREEWRP